MAMPRVMGVLILVFGLGSRAWAFPDEILLPEQILSQAIDLIERGEVQQARSTLRLYLLFRPHSAVGHYHMALVRRRLGDYEGAARHLEVALRLDGGSRSRGGLAMARQALEAGIDELVVEVAWAVGEERVSLGRLESWRARLDELLALPATGNVTGHDGAGDGIRAAPEGWLGR